MPLQFSLILGIIALPYVTQVREEPGTCKYGILAICTGIALLLVRSNSLYYFSAIFATLFVLESYWGRLNHLPVLLSIVVSPVIGHIIYIWSFPIRLQLSTWAGQALQFVGMNIQVSGNVLTLDGNTFSVDPACIGLKMVVTALVIGIIILAYFEKKRKQQLPFWKLNLVLSTIVITSIGANFIRLLALIVFHVLPDNPLHDAIGLFSLGLYVIAPFYFFAKKVYSKGGRLLNENAINSAPLRLCSKISRPNKQASWPENFKMNPKTFLIGMLLVLLTFNGRQFLHEPIENVTFVKNITIAGFQKEITPNGVLKLQNEAALIYIKPPVRFFQGSHDPRFCWQGSGYVFSEVKIQTIANKRVYTAKLQKDGDELYTAWWYENENVQTVDEWKWRWQSLQGNGGFYMLNVTCLERAMLEKSILYLDII